MRSRRKWLWEFSKKIVRVVSVLFVLVIIYDCALLWMNPDSTAADSLVSNMSDVFKVTVVAYVVKAGFENVLKISKGDQECDWREGK